MQSLKTKPLCCLWCPPHRQFHFKSTCKQSSQSCPLATSVVIPTDGTYWRYLTPGHVQQAPEDPLPKQCSCHSTLTVCWLDFSCKKEANKSFQQTPTCREIMVAQAPGPRTEPGVWSGALIPILLPTALPFCYSRKLRSLTSRCEKRILF